MLHKERKMLVDAKLLMEQLRGDAPWVPAGSLVRNNDIALFNNHLQPDGTWAAPPPKSLDRHQSLSISATTAAADKDKREGKVNGIPAREGSGSHANVKTENGDQPSVPASADAAPAVNSQEVSESKVDETVSKQDATTMEDDPSDPIRAKKRSGSPAAADRDIELPKQDSKDAKTEQSGDKEDDTSANEQTQAAAPTGGHNALAANGEVNKSSNPPTPSAISSPGSSPPARMQTRAQTNAANGGTPHLAATSRSPSPARPASPQTIHPMYLTVESALPDRDIGLPPVEAEELRRLLSIYIQKQEEVCRGTDRLYQALLKAVRLRDTVWWWARAEEHRGEMSDGEDWVDLEEWGLDEELKKGDVVTEETIEEQGKKPRGRRTAGG